MQDRIGVVVIGRNEGERLNRCLDALSPCRERIVYVDSGSSDGSVQTAQTYGADVLELDPARPFTAARARNEGVQKLARFASDEDAVTPDQTVADPAISEDCPPLAYIQFVDGDCEIAPEWWDAAAQYLDAHKDVAAVFGRLREREREASLFNRLCDIEWHVPPGDTDACLGVFMVRADSFRASGGFDEALGAGEEPDLAVRLRENGQRVCCLDTEMGLHDANMTTWSQWWRRTRRAGYAYAACAWKHRNAASRFWMRDTASIVVWGGLLPLAILASLLVGFPAALLLLFLYPVLFVRVYQHARRRPLTRPDSLLFASACVVGKWAQCQGCLLFVWDALHGRRRGSAAFRMNDA